MSARQSDQNMLPGTGYPDPPENQSADTPDTRNADLGAITCQRCGNWWTGLLACHCSACHETFTTIQGFDMHRRNDKCLNPADIRTRKGENALVPANRGWRGWQRPGRWEGPE